MKVETFEVEEVSVQTEECTEEAAKIIGQLGLEGQEKYYKKDNGAGAIFCPYRFMTKEEFNVYHALCPQLTALSKYDSGPIPVRVLQIASHASGLQLGKLFIMHPHDIKEDPVLVAMESEYASKRYLLARWGDVLEEFSILKEKAKKILIENRTAALQKIAAEVQADLSSVNGAITGFLNGNGHSEIMPYYQGRS